MNHLIDRHGSGQGRDLLKLAQRLADRITWLRLGAFAAMIVPLGNDYAPLNLSMTPNAYVAVGTLAMIGCWTVSGWLLDLSRLLFPRTGRVSRSDDVM